MHKIAIKVVSVANLPREICMHCFGKEHSIGHRMAVGAAVMAGGVLLTRVGHHVPEAVSVAFDVGGGFIHAVGATPYLEWLLASEA